MCKGLAIWHWRMTIIHFLGTEKHLEIDKRAHMLFKCGPLESRQNTLLPDGEAESTHPLLETNRIVFGGTCPRITR